MVTTKPFLAHMSIRTWSRNLRAVGHARAALEELKRLQELLPSAESRFAVPFVFAGRGHFKTIAPKQNPDEIEGLYRRICLLSPKRVLEVGTAHGGTLYLWCQAALADAHLISLDLPDGPFGGSYLPCRIPLYQAFARLGQRLDLVREDSHAPATLTKVRSLFGDQLIDFAFIDGDHTEQGVRQDLAMFGPLVRPGGLIAFHDILPRPEYPDIQVHRLWNDIKHRYPSEEFIAQGPRAKTIGIGVITVPQGGLAL